MDLQRQEYPSMLTQLQPGQAVKLLNDRLSQIKVVNNEVADWLQERRRIEEQYVVGLKKLAGRPLGATNDIDLGIFTTPWQKVVAYTENQAESHHAFSRSMERDVEKPLREFTGTNRELINMSNVTGNLNAIARDVESAEKKADKLKDKGGKASVDKVANAATSVDDAKGQWDSQAPYVFEKLQEVDELRLEHMRSCLTQFQTLASETHSSVGVAAEQALNSLLNVRTEDEITNFAKNAPAEVEKSAQRDRRMSRPPPQTQSSNTTSVPATATSSLAPPPIDEELVSQRSNSFVQEAEKKGKLSGLRRLGTVLKGRRNSTHPYGQQQLPSPEKKRSSTNLHKFSPFGKRKDTSDTLSPEAAETPNPLSRQGTGRAAEAGSSSAAGAEALASSSRAPELPPVDNFPEITPVADRELTNGTHTAGLGEMAVLEPTRVEPPTSTGLQAPLQPQSVQQVQQPLQPEPVQKEVEPQHQGSDAITQAMQEAALVDGANSNFKVDILNAPIQEEASDSTAAMASVATALRSISTPRRAPTLRGRRGDRNTMLLAPSPVPDVPIGSNQQASTSQTSLPQSPETTSTTFPASSSVPQSATQTAPPFKLAHRSTLAADESAASDTHSIKSARSLSSSVMSSTNATKHADIHDPGLNASVVETVSAWFTPEGAVTRAIQTGEVALAYNAPSEQHVEASTHPHQDLEDEAVIRFEGFGALEKVAPNPHFIDAVQGRGDGVYNVHFGRMASATGHGGKMAVAFKYQVHLDATKSAGEQVPISVTMASKVDSERNQTLVKLNYGLNEQFKFSTAESVAISGLMVILHVDPTSPGKVVQCQANNGGIFARDRGLVYWRLGDITLQLHGGAAKPEQDLLVRFATEGEIRPGSLETRWEIVGERLPGGAGSGISLSKLVEGAAQEAGAEEADPFADEDGQNEHQEAGASGAGKKTEEWTAVKDARRLKSGTYLLISGGPSGSPIVSP